MSASDGLVSGSVSHYCLGHAQDPLVAVPAAPDHAADKDHDHPGTDSPAHGCVSELDLNPVVAVGSGVAALDIKIKLAPAQDEPDAYARSLTTPRTDQPTQ
jgi:hypothetical protein